LSAGASASPAGLTARARPGAGPETRAANLRSAPCHLGSRLLCLAVVRVVVHWLVGLRITERPGRFIVIQKMGTGLPPYDLHTIRTWSTSGRCVYEWFSERICPVTGTILGGLP
jgi:hypothetical protein